MQIRQATPSDIDAITAMCTSSLRAAYGAFLSEEDMRPWIEGPETANYVRTMIDQMLVAEGDGKVVGVVSLKDDMIELLWVTQEARGQGIGQSLMKEAERALLHKGLVSGKLECFEPNEDAIAFYTKLGWQRSDCYPDPDAGVNKVLLTKELLG